MAVNYAFWGSTNEWLYADHKFERPNTKTRNAKTECVHDVRLTVNKHPLGENKIWYVHRVCVCDFIYTCTNWLKTINKSISHKMHPHFFNSLLADTYTHMHVRTAIKISSINDVKEIKKNLCNNFTLLFKIFFFWLGHFLQMPEKKLFATTHKLLLLKERTKNNVNWNRNTPNTATFIAFYFLIISSFFSLLLGFHHQSWPSEQKMNMSVSISFFHL